MPHKTKAARNAWRRNDYKTHPEKYKDRMTRYTLDNPSRIKANKMLNEIRSRVDNPVEIDLDWIESRLLAGNCEVTGLCLIWHPVLQNEDNRIYWPSIDRIDNKIGYTIDNCRLVCLGFNMLKSTCTDEDAFRVASRVPKPISQP